MVPCRIVDSVTMYTRNADLYCKSVFLWIRSFWQKCCSGRADVNIYLFIVRTQILPMLISEERDPDMHCIVYVRWIRRRIFNLGRIFRKILFIWIHVRWQAKCIVHCTVASKQFSTLQWQNKYTCVGNISVRIQVCVLGHPPWQHCTLPGQAKISTNPKTTFRWVLSQQKQECNEVFRNITYIGSRVHWSIIINMYGILQMKV